MNNNILVIGATGKTGSRVVKQLQQRGIEPRMGSRNASPSFDWNNKDTWVDSLKGIERMYVTYYPDLAVPGAKEAIESLTYLALEMGVQKIVLMSGKGETEAEACEQIIINSGMNYTIVRASWFNQNWSESFFLEPILSGQVALPLADVPIPFVDANDIAEVATEALLNDAYNSQILEVTGPNLITFKDAVDYIAKASGRELQLIAITLDQYLEGLAAADVPKDYIWLIEYLFSHVLTNPDNQTIVHDVEKVLGRKAKTFEEYAKDTTESGVWNQALTLN